MPTIGAVVPPIVSPICPVSTKDNSSQRGLVKRYGANNIATRHKQTQIIIFPFE